MQGWFLYVVGGCALVLVAFAHLDEHKRERQQRADIAKLADLHRHLVGDSTRMNEPTSLGT